MTLANGTYPASALAVVRTAKGQMLRAEAAAAWDDLAEEVRRRFGWTPGLTDSYRPYTVQERIFLERYRTTYQEYAPGRIDRRTWRGQTWWRRRGVASASTPGLSNHGLGLAVDVTALGGFNGQRYKQLASVAPSFGWSNATGKKIDEAWHWEFTGKVSAPTGTPGAPTSRPASPISPASEEDDMFNDADRGALTELYKKNQRLEQIAEALVKYHLDKDGRGFQADSRVLGVLPDKRNADKSVATVLTTAEGQVLRNDIAASTARAVAETSAAFHQLVAKIGGIEGGDVDVERLAAALKATLGSAVADELATRLKGA